MSIHGRVFHHSRERPSPARREGSTFTFASMSLSSPALLHWSMLLNPRLLWIFLFLRNFYPRAELFCSRSWGHRRTCKPQRQDQVSVSNRQVGITIPASFSVR